jgi:DNA-binding MarR family transcriptional regulator
MTAKRCVDDMERRGLLQSAHRGADRRSRALELTPEGLALSARIDTLVRAQEQHLDAALGPDRRSRLEEALGALESDLGLPPVPAIPPRQERP